MAEAEFEYNGTKTIIQCNIEDKLSIIADKFLFKCKKNRDNVYFLYNGQILNENVNFNEISNNEDINRKKMNIIVYDRDDKDEKLENNKKSSLIKSKYIICPKCKDCINLSINDFRISLNDCKNGDKFDEMTIQSFEKTQYIDQSKIICQNCKNFDKSKTFENKFFICLTCKMELCPLCKSSHYKSHYIVDYEEKDYICSAHNDIYVSYCKDCKKDICTLCLKEHNKHTVIAYGNILPDINKFTEELEKAKKYIEEYKNKINDIVSKLIDFGEDLDKYYIIFENLIKSFEIRKRNYSIIQNINNIIEYNNLYMKDLNKEISSQLNDIIDTQIFKRDEGPLIYDNGNIAINIVKSNLIFTFKDKKICVMTTEYADENEKSKFNMIKHTKRLNSDINNFYSLFDRSCIKYISNFKEFLNKNGDTASSEFDKDDDNTEYYCLITKKTIKELYELNKIYCKSLKE